MKQHSSADPITGLQALTSSASSPIPVGSSASKSDFTPSGTSTHRIIWCLYVPEPGQEDQTTTATTQSNDDASRIFALCRKSRAHIINLDKVINLYDPVNKIPLNLEEIFSGHLIIDEHKSNILTASFSPDGSAIATACADGEIGFFRISFNEAPSLARSSSEGLSLMNKQTLDNDDGDGNGMRCLKKWKPHDSRPITSLYFLDDHKASSADAQFWSFILTGTDYNREIKIWDCRDWQCLQTLRFHAPQDDPNMTPSSLSASLPAPMFKTAIDLSSKYLIMSDIMRKCFLVLHLQTDMVNNKAECFALSEFLLAYPALSFVITETAKIKVLFKDIFRHFFLFLIVI